MADMPSLVSKKESVCSMGMLNNFSSVFLLKPSGYLDSFSQFARALMSSNVMVFLLGSCSSLG
ncbi:MAG: hypothetical protein ACD_44C00467G0001 [uncultured bacterium]|nr:MAG: hypothetical protein ACD_44C00467G0001 [uncultured bacterium]